MDSLFNSSHSIYYGTELFLQAQIIFWQKRAGELIGIYACYTYI
jgi:hypothetical protein